MLTTALTIATLTFASCEKDGGSYSSASGNNTPTDDIPLPKIATLYNYIGRIDIESIAEQFRNKGYTVEIHYPEVEEGDSHGSMHVEKHNNTGSAQGYTLSFDLRNSITKCEFYLSKNKARANISSVLNDQILFCQNWTLTSLSAMIIKDRGNTITRYDSEEEFQAAFDEIDSPTEKIWYHATYENGFSFYLSCNEDIYLKYSIERED